MNLLGIQTPNVAEAYGRPTLGALARLRPRHALFLAYDVQEWEGLEQHSALAARLRARGSVPLLRCYARDIPQRDPSAWAAECARRATVFFESSTGEIIPANEMNWPGAAENGHDDYDRHRVWLSAFVGAYRAIRPQDRLHLPAPWSGWVGEDNERAIHYWRELKEVIPLYDVVDVHAYADGWGLHTRCRELLEAAGIRRPLLVSEFNRVPFDRVCRDLAGTPGLEGAVYFILDSPDEAFWQFSLLRDPGLMAAFGRAQGGPVEPIVPAVGAVMSDES
jgi:hypothetical protein